MSVTYQLKIVNDKRTIPIEEANSTHLQEVDKYTYYNFYDENNLLSKYHVRNYSSSKNEVIITHTGNGHPIKGIVYGEDRLFFNTIELRRQLNIYGLLRDKNSYDFISYIARKFICFQDFEAISRNILSKINSDCSNEYYQFLKEVFKDYEKNYRYIRELYFLKKQYERIIYTQMNMTDYINGEQAKKR